MRAEIDARGTLTIFPDSPTERYAVNAWSEKSWVNMKDQARAENGHWRGSSLIVNLGIPDVQD